VHQQDTKSPIDGPPPEIGAAHGHCGGGRGHINIFVAHFADPAGRQPEGGYTRLQPKFTSTFLGIEHITVDRNLRVLA